MPYFHALATDYDGTIARDGVVDDATIASLEKLKQSGRKLILATGRQLEDLERVFARLELFDRVVAENGALLYSPAGKEVRALAPAPPADFARRLARLGVQPLSVGRVVVATWEPNETAVLRAIRELGLDLQIIFNKGAVMVLPNGVNKASGLGAALEDLGLSAHNVVAAGDAENDLAFMRVCGCAAAVANALEPVKAAANVVTAAARGAGVAELIAGWLADEARLLSAAIDRHSIPIGKSIDDEREIFLKPDGGSVLITGASGGGKSTLATALLERLASEKFQLCVFDPEGDYAGFGEAVSFGDANTAITSEAVLAAVQKLGTNVTINLLGSGVQDRPGVFASLLPGVLAIRAKYGRPHWILVDEAHHMLPRAGGPADEVRLDTRTPIVFVTVHPDTLASSVLEGVGAVLLIGRDGANLIEPLSRAFGRPCPAMPERGPEVGEAIYWACRRDDPPVLIRTEQPRNALKRHTRKYALGKLGDDRSFFFRGRERRLNIRAQNLEGFLDIGDGVDTETYLFHLRNGDFAGWLRASIKDEELADEVAEIAANQRLDATEARKLVRAAVERRYTAPAEPG
jgi:hypothetical protein